MKKKHKNKDKTLSVLGASLQDLISKDIDSRLTEAHDKLTEPWDALYKCDLESIIYYYNKRELNYIQIITHSSAYGHLNVLSWILNKFPEEFNYALKYSKDYKNLKSMNHIIELDKGIRFNCYECIIRSTCTELCKGYLK